MTRPVAKPDQEMEKHAKAGSETRESRSHLPGRGNDERGDYGRGTAEPEKDDHYDRNTAKR